MRKEFVKSVCMVCMLCTIHTHCAVHHNLSNLDKVTIPHDHGDRNLSRPDWNRPFEPVESALNPQLDLKQFKSTQSGKHRHLDDVNDNVEFTSHHRGPTMNVGVKSVDSVSQSKSVLIERLRSGGNEKIAEQNVMNSNLDSIDRDLKSVNNLDAEFSSVLDSKTQRFRISRETKVVGDLDKQLHIRKVFDKFGNGETMTYEGFEQLLKTLGLERLVSDEAEKGGSTQRKPQKLNVTNMQSLHNTNSINNNATQVNQVCLKSRDIFTEFVNSTKSKHVTKASSQSGRNASATEARLLDEEALYRMCPSLLYQLTSATAREREEGCFFVSEKVDGEQEEINMGQVWLYATLSILGISLCGLLGVAVIPIMQHVFYQQLLQFLVALAIGTLCGDALLHLLPHAMTAARHEGSHHGVSTGHDHEHEHSESNHDINMWRGFVAAVGLVFFFITEKCLLLGGEWLKQRQRKNKVPGRVRVMRDADNNTGNSTVGEKLCKHKYSSYPYCYGEITTEITDDNHHKTPQYNKTEHNHNTSSPMVAASDNGHHVVAEEDHEPQVNLLANNDAGKVVAIDKGEAHELNPSEAESYTVIIREHENAHHGHSHSHGHVHSAPGNLTSVACMVIMGDGLHNLTDGMAIGAAFASNLAGGFSTAIAVFCHELPHELGDFAVLLKAGMSLKEAIFYNMMSSLLCLLGMIGGVLMGRDEDITQWVFALAAGMFLYIALVDMIPELTSSHSKEGGSFCQFLLQILGLVTGLLIMLLIATYEHDLKTIFSD